MSIVSLKKENIKIQNHKKFELISSLYNTAPSIVAKHSTVNGNINSAGTIEIEGIVYGEINAKILIIRESGFFQGTVIAEEIYIQGKIEGSIVVNKISISQTAILNGNISYKVMSVQDGASIDAVFKKCNQDS
jgi:cytoskeletal protein CcmA (bactofilin family)